MLCRRFPELAKSLQIRIFSERSFSRVFKLFVWVAAQLLHIVRLAKFEALQQAYSNLYLTISICNGLYAPLKVAG
jgi:hypothetical protein